MALLSFLRRNKHERPGFVLYRQAVAAARQTRFYAEDGVPDTLDGRFDMVGLHVALLVRRLRRAQPPGPALAQAVFDAMFSDMDMNLREMGVGDLSVGKKVKAMWEALHGRAMAYDAALDAGNEGALADAIGRNVWRGTTLPPGAARIARYAMRQDAHLASLLPAKLGGLGQVDPASAASCFIGLDEHGAS